MSYISDHDPSQRTVPALTLAQLEALGRGPGSITVEHASADARTPWNPQQPELQVLVDVDEHVAGGRADAEHVPGALVVGRVFGTPVLMSWLPDVRGVDDQAVVDAVDEQVANLLVAVELRVRMEWRSTYVTLVTADSLAREIGWARVLQVWNPWPDVVDGQQLAERVHQRVDVLARWESTPHIYTQTRRHAAAPRVVRAS